jgi:hypothetical protein
MMTMSEQPSTADRPHLTEDELTLHYYRDDSVSDRDAAERHLAGCHDCRAALTRLKQVLALVDAHADVAAPEGFERVMWARVQGALPANRAAGWRVWFSPRRLVLAGSAAALVAAAFVAGRWSGGAAPTPAPAPAVVSAVPGGVLLVAVGDHLDRSQVVLVELLNAGPADADLSADRERAADLVAANRLLRQSAEFAGEAAVSDVLDDLERALIEIANGSDDSAVEELAALKARIESRGMLFRMRVVASEVRQREREEGARRAPES